MIRDPSERSTERATERASHRASENDDVVTAPAAHHFEWFACGMFGDPSLPEEPNATAPRCRTLEYDEGNAAWVLRYPRAAAANATTNAVNASNASVSSSPSSSTFTLAPCPAQAWAVLLR